VNNNFDVFAQPFADNALSLKPTSSGIGSRLLVPYFFLVTSFIKSRHRNCGKPCDKLIVDVLS
jgi:hypothetical protein